MSQPQACSCYLLLSSAGLAYAPLLAARMICGRFARPAAFVGACWAATRGVLRLIALRGMGPRSLLAQLKEAALNIGGSCISAAEKVGDLNQQFVCVCVFAARIIPSSSCQ